ncbi:ribonuclease HI family protein [Dermatophilus congolensis]|nr:ribonuclease HI family protein [Dermatophilus congolensis]MBO3132493.1 ribonuclease HI family protein [Dermatophilus congolensis]MBO3133346.1 ribonuclease HI family protein [Dermatophilus congolensis]MBO3135581.1 ribonuclease HI family protein [Dermatophilus congolensis]MBO3137820.1 ribonuclease HI family protein [Dermatophilus congolensis]
MALVFCAVPPGEAQLWIKRNKHVTNRLSAAADGSALGNPGPAGWGWYIDDNRWAAGGWPHGTNNMGELMAVLDLLRATREAGPLTIYCDSQYVINSITKWMPGWKRKGWKKGNGQPVLNLDLMQAIDAELNGGIQRDVEFKWVKGHAGHELNEAADRLANGAAVAYSKGAEPDPGPGLGGASVGVAPAFAACGQGTLFGDVEQDEIDVVVDLERALLEDDVRASSRMLERLLHPQWVKVEPSGAVLTRAEAVAGLAPAETDLELLAAERVSSDVVLLRWRGHTDGGTSLHSSLWQRVEERWRQRFSQSTWE